LLLNGSSVIQNRFDYKYSFNSDTLNLFSYILFGTNGGNQVLGLDTTVQIPCSNFQKLCYLNLITVSDTNSIYSPFDTFDAFYPIDTFSYNFNHCWPLAINNLQVPKVFLYPNPSSGIFNISFTNAINNPTRYYQI
jgi:hypothetical protein